MKYKRIAALGAAVSMILSMAACGGSGESGENGGSVADGYCQ